jgi:hypothetical protein
MRVSMQGSTVERQKKDEKTKIAGFTEINV